MQFQSIKPMNISIDLEARYLPESHKFIDHVLELGSLVNPGHFGLYLPTKFVLLKNISEGHQYFYTILQKDSMYLKRLFPSQYFIDQLKQRSMNHFVGKACYSLVDCVVIIAERYTETNFIEEYIDTFNLMAQVFWLDPEFSVIYESMIQANDIFLVLHWSPSEIIDGIVDLKLIQMPTCGQFQRVSINNKKAKCLFESIPTIKIASELTKHIPIFFDYLKGFKFTNQDYQELLDIYRDLKSVQNTACRWLKKRIDFYRSWLPKNIKEFHDPSENPFLIPIGLMLPTKLDALNESIMMARNDIIQSRLLKKYHFTFYKVKDSSGSTSGRTLELAKILIDSHVKGIIGPSASSELQIIKDVTSVEKLPVITYIPGIGVQEMGDHVIRTIGENTQYGIAIASFMTQNGWCQIAILSETGLTHTKYIAQMTTQFKNFNFEWLTFQKDSVEDIRTVRKNIFLSNVKVIISQKLCSYFSLIFFLKRLESILDKGYRIIYVDTSPKMYKIIMCLAAELKVETFKFYYKFHQ